MPCRQELRCWHGCYVVVVLESDGRKNLVAPVGRKEHEKEHETKHEKEHDEEEVLALIS